MFFDATTMQIAEVQSLLKNFFTHPHTIPIDALFMHAVSRLLHATARSQAWSNYVLAQPDDPPLEAPLPGSEQPARNAAAPARLQRILAERHGVEQLWFDTLHHTTTHHQKIIGRKFYDTLSLNLEYFDFHSTLSTIHPHRKLLQLLQQHGT